MRCKIFLLSVMKHAALDLLPSVNRTAGESQQRSVLQDWTWRAGNLESHQNGEVEYISEILSRNVWGVYTGHVGCLHRISLATLCWCEKILTSKYSYETMSVNYISEHMLLECFGACSVCVCVCVCMCVCCHSIILCNLSFVSILKGCSTFIFTVELSMKRTAWHWWQRYYAPSNCRWWPSRTQHFVALPWELHISQFYFLDEVLSLGIVLYYILLYYTSPWLMNFFSI